MAQVKSLTINGKDIIDLVYPVGSFYLSTESTPPQELFGGTWEQIKGRFLLGTGAIEENTTNYWGSVKKDGMNCPVGETGGEFKHTLTVAEMPSHSHEGNSLTLVWNAAGKNVAVTTGSSNPNCGSEAKATTSVGSNGAHNNMPPYYATYIWHRTA